MTTRDLTT